MWTSHSSIAFISNNKKTDNRVILIGSTGMNESTNRAHMRQPVIELVDKSERKTASETIGESGSDIIWQSYHDLDRHMIAQHRTGGLPHLAEPRVNKEKKTAIIRGKEVKRQPYIDDFADMMREEDKTNHQRLERYVNPLGVAGGLNWFKATMLAVMIEHGKVGLKETASGDRKVYMYRERTGNPFFRILSGRATLILALLQWAYIMAAFEYMPSGLATSVTVTAGIVVFYFYNLFHWRFHKRYAFVMGSTIIGSKGTAVSMADSHWATGRIAVFAICLAFLTAALFGFGIYHLGGKGLL